MLNRVEITVNSRATTVVYIQEYPITLPVIGICQNQSSMLAVYLYTYCTYDSFVFVYILDAYLCNHSVIVVIRKILCYDTFSFNCSNPPFKTFLFDRCCFYAIDCTFYIDQF